MTITPTGNHVKQRALAYMRCTEDNSHLLLTIYIFLLNLSVILILSYHFHITWKGVFFAYFRNICVCVYVKE